MKTEILRYLKEADGYISGQELCGQFHVSRTAVWKVMKQLADAGLLHTELPTVTGKIGRASCRERV